MAEAKLRTPADITDEIRERLEERWGDGWKDEDYIALERNYRNLCNDNPDMTSEIAMFLRDIAEAMHRRKKAIDMGDTKMINSLTSSIKQSFAAVKEARDQKVASKLSIDGLVRVLEERGLMKNGIMLMDGVLEYIRNDHNTFHMSHDAVDAMMLSIVNAMRFNNGVNELVELPEELQVQDVLGEFVEEPSYDERQLMMELGANPKRAGGT